MATFEAAHELTSARTLPAFLLSGMRTARYFQGEMDDTGTAVDPGTSVTSVPKFAVVVRPVPLKSQPGAV